MFVACMFPFMLVHIDDVDTMILHRRVFYTAVRFRVSSICDSWSRIRSIIREILYRTIGDADLRASMIKNPVFGPHVFASVKSSRSNSLYLSVNLSIFLSISSPFSINTYPAANSRGKQRQFLPHIDTYMYTETLLCISMWEKSL